MMPGVVDQHVEALVLGENDLDGSLPVFGRSHVEFHHFSAGRKFLRERVGSTAIGAHTETEVILRTLRKKGTGDGLAQATVGPGHEDDTRVQWARIVASGGGGIQSVSPVGLMRFALLRAFRRDYVCAFQVRL